VASVSTVACSRRRPIVFASHASARALLTGVYVFALAGASAAFVSLLSARTDYGAGYGVWFGGLVVVALAIVAGPIVGARVGGLDWDLGTMKDLHLGGRRVFSLQVRSLGRAVAVGLLLVVAGVLSALTVSALATFGGSSWRGSADMISAGMIVRLLLAGAIGLPFVALIGWAFGAVFRSAFRGALVVEGTLLVYFLVMRWVLDFAPLEYVYRFSPWGALMALVAGAYKHPVVVLQPAIGLGESVLVILGWTAVLLLVVWLSSVHCDTGGGGAS
jgi:hypothetical protein